jgi:putative FmdB family regulatory protein
MPIYEYKCPNGHLFEARHGMMEPSPEVCEICGAGPLVRVLHPVAVHYKGSGFYSTDYGKGSRKAGKDGKDGGKDGGSEKSEQRSDSSSGSGSSDSGSGSGSSDSGSGSSDSGSGSSGGKKAGDS